MKNVFWLASYPKSGNTWMRIFLTNYLRDSDHPADINQLDTDFIASSRSIFDEYAGVLASELNFDQIDRYRPEVYRRYAHEKHPEKVFIKVHDGYHLNDDGKPIFPEDISAGVLYLVRNPIDVAVSYAHHNHTTIKKVVSYMINSNYAANSKNNMLTNQLRQKMGTWSDHFQSWNQQTEIPVLLIRYEDLSTDPFKTFGEVIKFCGFDFCKERLEKAIKFSDFEILKSQEKKHGFAEKNQRSDSFFRAGKIGTGEETLTSKEKEVLLTAHESVMKRVGYNFKEVENNNF